MPQVTNSSVSLKTQARTHRTVIISALLAIAATAAIALVVAVGSNSSGTDSVAGKSQPALRSDSGPNESAVATAVAAPAHVGIGHSESSVAASVSKAQPSAGRLP